MAMIFDAFMPRFASLLTQMVQQDVGMLLGVPGEIEKLQQTIGDIQSVLDDANKKKIESEAIERWLIKLKDAMYDADDIMDLCQIKVQERLERSNSPSSSKLGCGFLKPLSCFRNPVFAYKIGTKIREINLRLEGIAKQKTDLGLIELHNAIGRPLVRRVDTFVNRETDTVVVLDDIVGEKIEEDVRLLVNWLTENEEGGVRNKISVVAIVGMGGIGKTTLAKRIFNDPKMEEFQLKIWICVSKQKGIDVLKCVIRGAGGDYGSRQERSELVDLLKSLVKEKKFLLVLDDVWPENIQFWDGLLRAPLMDGAHGSRLLVTTRDERVANSMMATKSHRVEKLPDEDGLSLLFKQVFQNDEERDIQEFKSIGMQLVEKCDGLPLAIKSIAGVLRTKIRTVEEWEKVLRSKTWFMKGLQADVHGAFYLSYEDLPSHLKQCFILLSIFPEDFTFDPTILIYFWLAEGYLPDNENLWELGKEYYRELLLRNLLEDTGRYIDQRECRMHDLLWSFAGDLGRHENLVTGERDDILNRKSTSKLRRFSIEAHEAKHDFFIKEKWLRTLLIGDISESALRDLCGTLSNLRILTLAFSNILTLPDSLSCLVHLRFLDLTGSKIKMIPVSVGKLRNLNYLNLIDCTELSHLPHTITNLRKLRLLTFVNSKVETFPAGLRKLENLIELYGFKPDYNNFNGFSCLDELEALSHLITLHLYALERVSQMSIAKQAKISSMEKLQTLHLEYTSLSWEDQMAQTNEKKVTAVDVLNELCPPRSLKTLLICGYFGNYLPDWLNLGATLPNLRILEIENCNCIKNLGPLGQLPNLYSLKIEGAHSVVSVNEEFFRTDMTGRDSKASSRSIITAFPKLNQLQFIDMSNWIDWQWEKGVAALPNLKRFVIENCPQLRSLPEGLSHHATSLEYLNITDNHNLVSIENFPSIKELLVIRNPNLERISNLRSVSHIMVYHCPILKNLENLNTLRYLQLEDYEMEVLPEYLMTTMPQMLKIWCSEELLRNIAIQRDGGLEWHKFKHIPKVKIYSEDQLLYAIYQKTPFSFNTNISASSVQS